MLGFPPIPVSPHGWCCSADLKIHFDFVMVPDKNSPLLEPSSGYPISLNHSLWARAKGGHRWSPLIKMYFRFSFVFIVGNRLIVCMRACVSVGRAWLKGNPISFLHTPNPDSHLLGTQFVPPSVHACTHFVFLLFWFVPSPSMATQHNNPRPTERQTTRTTGPTVCLWELPMLFYYRHRTTNSLCIHIRSQICWIVSFA